MATTVTSSPDLHTASQPPEFSLVLGGPLYQLFRRSRMCDHGMQLMRRRIMVLVLIAWAPLLVLSLLEGHLWGVKGDGGPLPFLRDLEMQVRLLLALPLLVIAEMVVHQRLMPLVKQFVQRGLVSEDDLPKFNAAVTSASRLRNSLAAELAMLAVVYIVGVGLVWRTVALEAPMWYGVHVSGLLRPSIAGWWVGLVSLPIFQFLLLRWYFRLFIWARFLWQVSRLDLRLMPTHPDRCGGLGFLAQVSEAFAPLLLAQGCMLAGLLANRIFYAGAVLTQFKAEFVGLVGFMLLVVVAPLLVFTPKLAAAKRDGLLRYGHFAQTYARDFDRKWLTGRPPADETLIGSADIQSLADLGNSFEVVKQMKPVPFSIQTVLQLAVISLLPVLPLTLTMMSLEQLLSHVLKLLV